MSKQKPLSDGYYYIRIGDSSPISIGLVEGGLVTNVFGRNYDVTAFQGVSFGERIPLEKECAAMEALRGWRDTLIEIARTNPKGVVAQCLAAYPGPSD